MNDKAQRASGVDRTMHSALGSTDPNREPECFQDYRQSPFTKERMKYQKPPEEEPTMIMGRTMVNNHQEKQCFPQCYGSRMFIPDPDFYPYRIPDPKTATKERGEKKFVVIPFL